MKMNFQVKVNMVGPPGSSLLLLSFLLFLCCPGLWSYEAPIDKQDVFAKNACPAFLTYRNVAFLSGVTVELPCRCKPEMVQSVTWFYRKHLDTSKDTRALTDHHGNKLVDPSGVLHSRSLQSRFSIRLFSLLIFRAGPDDSGVYVCGSSQGDYFYGYDLDIQEAQKIDFIQRFSSGAPSAEPDAVERPGSARSWYRLFTSFRPWSVCDRCGIPGEQIRIGLCYIRSHALHVRYRGAHQKVVSCGSGGKPKAFRRMKRSGAGAKMEAVLEHKLTWLWPGTRDLNPSTGLNTCWVEMPALTGCIWMQDTTWCSTLQRSRIQVSTPAGCRVARLLSYICWSTPIWAMDSQ
ncbi:Ig-like V-type domain-containing protein FAM187A isoform X2 [Takifugu rubripes]|uniref:Ig-like V-type domain-containing protein FAM187A isoform X2 n=1 Tax=Takifugu rubripes TaxID=31033 RepID=UPI0011454C24|nr:Ig-like V-type domain-containing protein FAM187A isoform X2 [Takifugu rubripes]